MTAQNIAAHTDNIFITFACHECQEESIRSVTEIIDGGTVECGNEECDNFDGTIYANVMAEITTGE